MVTKLVQPQPRLIRPYSKADASDFADASHAIIDIANDETLEASATVAAADQNESALSYGAVLALALGTTSPDSTKGNISQSLTTPYFTNEAGAVSERDVAVIVQPQTAPPGAGAINKSNIVAVTIAYQIGTVLLTKTLYLTSGASRLVMLTARQVSVSAQVINPSASTAKLNINVAVVPAEGNILQAFYTWGYAVSDGLGSGPLTIGAGAGVIGGCTVIMTAAGGATTAAPQYFMMFDSLVAPTTGVSVPIAGTVSPPLTGVNSFVNFGDDTAPGAIGFSSGLYFALSTTTGVYTAPGSPGTVNVQAKTGS